MAYICTCYEYKRWRSMGNLRIHGFHGNCELFKSFTHTYKSRYCVQKSVRPPNYIVHICISFYLVRRLKSLGWNNNTYKKGQGSFHNVMVYYFRILMTLIKSSYKVEKIPKDILIVIKQFFRNILLDFPILFGSLLNKTKTKRYPITRSPQEKPINKQVQTHKNILFTPSPPSASAIGSLVVSCLR